MDWKSVRHIHGFSFSWDSISKRCSSHDEPYEPITKPQSIWQLPSEKTQAARFEKHAESNIIFGWTFLSCMITSGTKLFFLRVSFWKPPEPPPPAVQSKPVFSQPHASVFEAWLKYFSKHALTNSCVQLPTWR